MGNAFGTTNIGATWSSGDLKLRNSSAEDILTIAEEAITFSKGFVFDEYAATATADGTGTGTIPEGASLVQVTSANAAHIVVLPAPTPGTLVIINVGANGCELRSSSPTTIAINGGTGAAAESAIGANVTAYLLCVSATAWKGFQVGSDGTTAGVEAAA